MNWSPPPKPAEFAETGLIDAILEEHFPIGSNLPAERELAALLGVTRPTLREALQRLARDGWIEIRHGKPTRVRDYWHEGNLGVLGAIARRAQTIPIDFVLPDFVPNLLAVRQLMAPVYTRLAVERSADEVARFLHSYAGLDDRAEVFARADWDLHHRLTTLSGNPIFTLILNGFCDLYTTMGRIYFSFTGSRKHSRNFYRDLHAAAQAGDPQKAEDLTRQVMQKSLDLWKHALKKQAEVEP